MPFVQHADTELFYTDQGEGPVVLLMHGWACDSHDWSWQIPALRDTHRVIAMDHRGHGRSTAPEGSYRAQVLADDAAALLGALAVGSAVVVGHSMGAIVASALAVRRPELVRALVLVDPVYGAPDERMAPAIAAMKGPEPSATAARLFETDFYTADTPPFLPTWHTRRAAGTPDHVVAGCILGFFEGEDALGRAAVAPDYLKRRTAPRLAVFAAEEAAALERSLPRNELDEIQVWPGSGHFLHQERPDEFNHLMLNWLGKL